MKYVLIAMLATFSVLQHPASAAEADAGRGQRVFGVCAACHSLEPNRNMTGPSLSELWHRQAGGLASFPRYSPALKSSGIIWEDGTLDAFVRNPQQLIPGNQMTFAGLGNAQQRADLIAFLRQATQPGQAAPPEGQGRGGMGGGQVPNLKKLADNVRVNAIALCGDTYRVTTADGRTRAFWERNLRFKTDSSSEGPDKGAPAIVGAGMMGDRASVIFAAPDEISAIISHKCQ
jgi:cytochrome c